MAKIAAAMLATHWVSQENQATMLQSWPVIFMVIEQEPQPH